MPPSYQGILVKILFFFFIPFLTLFLTTWFFWQHLSQAKGLLVNEDKLTMYEVEGIKIGYSPQNTPDRNRLRFLDFLIHKAPEAYLASKPKAIYFINSKDIQNSALSDYFGKAGGVTIGNSIYLMEGSNWEGKEIYKNYYLANILFHEWTHVVQFQKILKEDGPLSSLLSLVSISQKTNFPGKFILDYALKAGWEPVLRLPIEIYLLSNPQDSHKNDDYGASSLVESQATAAGYVMAGNASAMSFPRAKWVEDFTKKSSQEYLDDLVSYTYGSRVQPSGIYSP